MTEDKSYKETETILRIQYNNQHIKADRKSCKTCSSETPFLSVSKTLYWLSLCWNHFPPDPRGGNSLFPPQFNSNAPSLESSLTILYKQETPPVTSHLITIFCFLHHTSQYRSSIPNLGNGKFQISKFFGSEIFAQTLQVWRCKLENPKFKTLKVSCQY